MTTKIELLLPVARFVEGSLYEPLTKDKEGRPFKNALGETIVKFYFAIAIPKTTSHWNQTDWGKQIHDVAVQSWPQGQHQLPTFAWKILDGDSAIPNKEGNIPAQKEGFAGHWIVKFNTQFPVDICNSDGSQKLTEKDFVKLGDYVEIYCTVLGNNAQQSPGIYINPIAVAFNSYGPRIIATVKRDTSAIGFGKAPAPVGSMATPPAAFTPPVTASMPTPPGAPVQPYPQVLQGPQKVLTEKAKGATYEQLLALGWTDVTLIQQGLMVG